MPNFPRTPFVIFASLSLAQALSAPAFSADRNTYRPGEAYLQTVANSHMICEQQCRGDAQCRGWNFVRPNPGAATGICEFNSRAAMPVSSPISMSGEIVTSIDPLMSRAVPAGARTVRVGTPSRTAPPPERKSGTQVNRLPVQQQKAAQPVSTKPTTNPPRTYGAAPQPPSISAATTAAPAAPQMSPQQQQFRQQFLAEQQRQRHIHMQQQAMLRQQQQMQQRQPGPIALRAPTPRPMPQAAFGPPATAPAQQHAPRATTPMVPQPLYGSLHDDLTKNMTPVPRPATAPDNLNDPHAPVATSRAAPTQPVETKLLDKKLVPGLAGG